MCELWNVQVLLPRSVHQRFLKRNSQRFSKSAAYHFATLERNDMIMPSVDEGCGWDPHCKAFMENAKHFANVSK